MGPEQKKRGVARNNLFMIFENIDEKCKVDFFEKHFLFCYFLMWFKKTFFFFFMYSTSQAYFFQETKASLVFP